MNDADGHRSGTHPIGCLVVAARLPVGVVGIGFVLLFFLLWFVSELLVATLAFPVAAVFTSQTWIRDSWLGRFPISLRAFAAGRFGPVRAIWGWVGDPKTGAEASTAEPREPAVPAGGVDTPSGPPAELELVEADATSSRPTTFGFVGGGIGAVLGVAFAVLMWVVGGHDVGGCGGIGCYGVMGGVPGWVIGAVVGWVAQRANPRQM